MTNFTFNAIENAYVGNETVTFNARVLQTFKGKDGSQVTGAIDDLCYLLRTGYINGFKVSEPEVIDGKKVFPITITGFDPTVTVTSKKGNTFTWFKGASSAKRILDAQKVTEAKVRKTA